MRDKTILKPFLDSSHCLVSNYLLPNVIFLPKMYLEFSAEDKEVTWRPQRRQDTKVKNDKKVLIVCNLCLIEAIKIIPKFVC